MINSNYGTYSRPSNAGFISSTVSGIFRGFLAALKRAFALRDLPGFLPAGKGTRSGFRVEGVEGFRGFRV